jgi:hypothetical protein
MDAECVTEKEEVERERCKSIPMDFAIMRPDSLA